MVGITSKPKPDKLPEIQLLRVICILGVVAFHTYGMTFTGNHFNESTKDFIGNIYHVPIECWLINIAMPLFMAISGYLFFYLLDKDKYSTWPEMLKKKATRILIPYFVWAGIMMVTTDSWHEPWRVFSSYWHLWFLPTLMWCFIAGYALRPVIKNIWGSVLLYLGFTVLMLFPKWLPAIMGLHNFDKWFGWFLLGAILFVHNKAVIGSLRKYHLLIPLLLAGIIIGVVAPMPYGENSIPFAIGQTLVIVSIWGLLQNANLGWIDKATVVLAIDECSFGIYIFHNWLGMYMVSRTAKRLLPLEQWLPDHPYLFPFCFFMATLVVSFIATKLVRTFSWGRKLV